MRYELYYQPSIQGRGEFGPVEAEAQDLFVELPIQVSKPVSRLAFCLLGYGPQEGSPVFLRHSFGTGCL